MKCQILFTGKNKKNNINLSSAENAQRVVKAKLSPVICVFGVIYESLQWNGTFFPESLHIRTDYSSINSQYISATEPSVLLQYLHTGRCENMTEIKLNMLNFLLQLIELF